MNLAENISDIDFELENLTKSLSDYYITNKPEEIPYFNEFINYIFQERYLKEVFPTLEEVYKNIKELRYFLNKTEILEHKVLVASFHLLDYYFIQKDDGSSTVCCAPYLHEETAIQLRVYDFNYYSID